MISEHDLERFAALERDGVLAAIARRGGSVDAALRGIAAVYGEMAAAPGFRGCPFHTSDHPQLGALHRFWWRTTVEELLSSLDLVDPEGVAADLLVVRDGVLVAGHLDSPDGVAAAFLRGCRAVIRTSERAKRQ